jgi:hypothetical protein
MQLREACEAEQVLACAAHQLLGCCRQPDPHGDLAHPARVQSPWRSPSSPTQSRRPGGGLNTTQDGDSVGRTHDRAESKEALSSPPAVEAACLAVVKKASADSFASLTASTV